MVIFKTDEKSIRAWAKSRGWPAPQSHFEDAFIAKMLENDEIFGLALSKSGIDVSIPKRDHPITSEELSSLDELYEEGPWDLLVYWLREIRRAVEAGVVVQVEDTTLSSFDGFYDWAHGRYYKLEDDMRTGWIGDDSPLLTGW